MKNTFSILLSLFTAGVCCASEETSFQGLPTIENPKSSMNGSVPKYPKAARNERICGIVRLAAVISEGGTVEDIKILSAQPSGYFEEATLTAARKWSFETFLKDGAAVKYQAIFPVHFKIEPDCNPNYSFRAGA